MENTDTKAAGTGRATMDGCTAAAYIAYAMSDVATIYPITPIASMGETAQKWAVQGRKNLMGQTMQVKEMESELGAAGATHGALAAGGLATTFTSSQGLMLMIPNMYKISGELLPGVFHVGTRSLATQALSIFGDHQDVMACRATGFAFLASCNVQETMDLALVAHLAAIEGSLPVCHFFDGWRTSNQVATVETIGYEKMRPLVDWDAVARFRERGLNPEHPVLRGSAQDSEVYFQNREAPNRYYDAFPAVVQRCMDKVAGITGRRYRLFDYAGHAQATDVVVVMGSAGDVVEQTLASLNADGYCGGVVKVRLYRPFSADALLAAVPPTAKRITVLDRTKEPGADGEPLYKDVATALARAGRDVKVYAGRFGLASKEFDPAMAKAVFDNMMSPQPKAVFTVGIDDDVTHLSLDVKPYSLPVPPGALQSVFYGFGSDGTVGATRQLAVTLADVTGGYAQAYFSYSAKKSGGYTLSQLRLSPGPLSAEYDIEGADYVACHKDTYVGKYRLLKWLRPGGVFVLNSPWGDVDSADAHLPGSLKREIAAKGARFYNIDAAAIAAKYGLGVRINMIMAAVYLHLTDGLIPADKAMEALQGLVKATYIHEGEQVVANNLAAMQAAGAAIRQIAWPEGWAEAEDTPAKPRPVPAFVEKVARVCDALEGDTLPVSAFTPDGTMPMGTTAYEKRRIALRVPRWTAQKCVECTLCSYVCAHAAIRPFLLTDAQAAGAPEGFTSLPAKGADSLNGLHWRIQVYTEDCTGCGSCATVCPGHALDMVPASTQMDAQIPQVEYMVSKVGYRPGILPRFTVRGSQMYQPLLEFSGACGGCGETPYIKLLTQLFGERMVMANATGCSSIWGANYPSNAYCTNSKGHGPAWANSLFEDNAEFGYGMAVALEQRRAALRADADALADAGNLPSDLADAVKGWLNAPAGSATEAAETLRSALLAHKEIPEVAPLAARTDLLLKKSVWAVGGDGWAYDIGFAGLDHVLARRTDLNILVMDTECYSNTGGQMSKATPLGAVAKYAPQGKRTFKKDLGRMMMSYGNVYVASVSMGANPQQAVDALKEAEAYPGPSIVLTYCPCINHGIRAGMGDAMVEERRAVRTGYWPLYRYNPLRREQGLNPLRVDSASADGKLDAFLDGESRYASLAEKDASLAATLREELARREGEVYSLLTAEAGLKDC